MDRAKHRVECGDVCILFHCRIFIASVLAGHVPNEYLERQRLGTECGASILVFTPLVWNSLAKVRCKVQFSQSQTSGNADPMY
jgi:hypothetical protein